MKYEELKRIFKKQEMFHGKTWKLSPEAFKLSQEEYREIEEIGGACREFYLAIDRLYYLSKENKKILRNKELHANWVLDYWESGKPGDLMDHVKGKQFKGSIPAVIRPDLLITEEGFKLTELDSVPGGYGLTAFLDQIYKVENNMVEYFHEGLRAVSGKEEPNILILVAEEAATYRPEFDWLGEQLLAQGHTVRVEKAEEMGDFEGVDVIYRFFELFDLENISATEKIRELEKSGALVVTPPMKAFQEEKLNLGLFYHGKLAEYWDEVLSKHAKKVLGKIIPKSWVMDPRPLGPHGSLLGPEIGGKSLGDWKELGELSQKERNFVIKISGYDERAWGSKGVTIGNDCSSEEWNEAIDKALKGGLEELYVLQEFTKPKVVRHQIYDDAGNLKEEKGRVRLCPYYVNLKDKVETMGILATICPVDKKVIHGMEDGALLPCVH